MTVQAINSKIADLRIHGKRIGADISEAIVGDVRVKRTLSVAPSISLSCSDPNMKLLSRPFGKQRTYLTIDDLDFVTVQVKHKNGDTSLTFEDAAVARLRRFEGPKKAFRDKITRAQFIGQLAREADVPFVSPERRIEQPIEKHRSKAKRKAEKNENREYGFDKDAAIRVKGVRADRAQVEVAETILDVGVQLGASFRVLVMAIACATQESNMVDLETGDYAAPNSKGPFGMNLLYYPKAGDLEEACRYMYLGISDHEGLIATEKANPGMSFTEVIATVQRPRSDLRGLYQQWKGEAGDTVREYLGGESTTTYEQEVEKPYSFEVKKNETYWEAIQRLAKEVNWRAFVSAGKLFYFTDQRLLRSRPRMRVSADYANEGTKNFPPGIDDVEFDIHMGKKVQSAVIKGRAAVWAAPPGSAVIFAKDFGPASGRWLVSDIETSLSKPDVTIKLKRPSKPLPEPAPETVTRSVTVEGSPAGGSAGAAKAVKWAKGQVGVTEGSAKWQRWMSAVGGFDPWCSFWIGYMMKYVCGFEHIPSNVGDSACWDDWSRGDVVSMSNIEPGDIIEYGPGAHVGFYIGGGRCISGNYSNAVTEHGLHDHPSPAAVAVRPKYRD